MQKLSFDGLSRAYREDKGLQEEYPSVYEYLLYQCGGDFDLFDNQIEVKELFIREHNEEIRNLNVQIKELRMQKADQVVKDFFDELKTRKGQKVTVVVNYKPGMHPLDTKQRRCGDHSQCCDNVDWDDDEGYPPFITEVITGQARVIIRGKDKSAYVADGETAVFWNRFNDHPDYYYYESKIHGFQSSSDITRHYDYLEDRFDAIDSIRFMFEDENMDYEDTKLSDKIDWYAGERMQVINNLLVNFLGKNKKYPVEIVHRHELQETLENILEKMERKDNEDGEPNSYYQWKLVRDALDDYFCYQEC